MISDGFMRMIGHAVVATACMLTGFAHHRRARPELRPGLTVVVPLGAGSATDL